MARPFNPNCGACEVLKDDSNTARLQARGGVFDSYCRVCRKRMRQQRTPALTPRSTPRVISVTKETRELRKRLKESSSFGRFEEAMERLRVVLVKRLEIDPSLAAFRVALRRYEAALLDERYEQSKRDLAAAMHRVADQPHAPWTNVIACRECTREVTESITHGLRLACGRESATPYQCRERVESQANHAGSRLRG